MERVLALDISSKPGWAVIDAEGDDKKLVDCGSTQLDKTIVEYGPYPFCYSEAALDIAAKCIDIVKRFEPRTLVIEETNLGKSRYAQKFLEFAHQSFLLILSEECPEYYLGTDGKKLLYFDTSSWRTALGLKLSKDQKKQNAKLSKEKRAAAAEGMKLDKKALGIRGKVTWKHLSVERANSTFGLSLKMKDNDTADAICIGLAALANATPCDGV